MASAGKKGSALGTIAPLLILTVLAGGGGALVGREIMTAARVAAEKAAAGPDGAKAAPGPVDTRALKELTPIVTNLASPDGAWIRLQAAIVYDKANAADINVVASKIGEDVLAFVRTLTLAQIQGASGLEALRDDLNERAALRSDGKVRELLIETLVVR